MACNLHKSIAQRTQRRHSEKKGNKFRCENKTFTRKKELQRKGDKKATISVLDWWRFTRIARCCLFCCCWCAWARALFAWWIWKIFVFSSSVRFHLFIFIFHPDSECTIEFSNVFLFVGIWLYLPVLCIFVCWHSTLQESGGKNEKRANNVNNVILFI